MISVNSATDKFVKVYAVRQLSSWNWTMFFTVKFNCKSNLAKFKSLQIRDVSINNKQNSIFYQSDITNIIYIDTK